MIHYKKKTSGLSCSCPFYLLSICLNRLIALNSINITKMYHLSLKFFYTLLLVPSFTSEFFGEIEIGDVVIFFFDTAQNILTQWLYVGILNSVVALFWFSFTLRKVIVQGTNQIMCYAKFTQLYHIVLFIPECAQTCNLMIPNNMT